MSRRLGFWYPKQPSELEQGQVLCSFVCGPAGSSPRPTVLAARRTGEMAGAPSELTCASAAWCWGVTRGFTCYSGFILVAVVRGGAKPQRRLSGLVLHRDWFGSTVTKSL